LSRFAVITAAGAAVDGRAPAVCADPYDGAEAGLELLWLLLPHPANAAVVTIVAAYVNLALGTDSPRAGQRSDKPKDAIRGGSFPC
jgi:hypothetical protein